MSNSTVTPEVYWLTLTALMTGLMWLPYILNRLAEQGVGKALWDPQGETETRIGWADRMMRAHQNAVENLVVFAPLVLALQAAGLGDAITATACMVYFYARAAHVLVFSLGIPLLRIPSFAVGVACQMVLGLRLLGIL